jgi:hypothetical protein
MFFNTDNNEMIKAIKKSNSMETVLFFDSVIINGIVE